METYVENYLKENNIEYIEHKHPAVFTVAESSVHCANIPGLHCKNLFLKDRDNNKFYLVVMPAKKRLDVKLLQKKLEVKKLTFGSAEELKELLVLEPGSVSPLGIINDKDHKVTVIVAKEVWDTEIVGFHPNINTATLEIKQDSFQNLMKSFKNRLLVVDLE